MQVIEREQNRIILRFQRSFIKGLVIGITVGVVGLFFCLVGLAIVERTPGGTWILPLGMGVAALGAGMGWTIAFPKIVTFTFDKSQQHILLEESKFLYQPVKKIVEIPIESIVGVEIVPNEDLEAYYANLILDRLYWRIIIESDGSYQTAVEISQLVSQFLDVNYFPDASKAPLPIWKQRYSERLNKERYSWQYFQDEIDRLQQYLSIQPQDAQAHQDLGIMLNLSNRSHCQEAIFHLQQAESLFTAQQQQYLASITRVILLLVG
jgi:hypothetical protein